MEEVRASSENSAPRRIFADAVYNKKELIDLIHSLSEDSLRDLEEFFGLKRISHSPVEYLGEHVIDSLRNKAIGRIIELTESPITRDELRLIRKKRKPS